MTRPPSPDPIAGHPLLAPDAPRPLLDPRRRQLLVRNLRRLGAELGLYPSPMLLAELLGIRLVWRTEHDAAEGVVLPRNVVLYDFDTDPRERDLNALCALVGAFLKRQRVAHNASDVRLFALDFAVPMEAVSVDPEEMVARQRHCPEAIIRQVIAMRSRA